MSDNRRRLLFANSRGENGSTSIVDQFSFTVCSLNITTSTNLQHPWSDRLYAIDNNDLFSAPKLLHYDTNGFTQYDMWKYDIIGFQEVANYVNQLDDIVNLLGDDYGYYSAYRGVTSVSSDNEACPIFYNKNKFTLVTGGRFWLSSTPDVESLNWVKEKRICVYAILEENATKQNILVLNTHLPSYQKYINGVIQKGEAISWSLNVIRKKIDSIILNHGKLMPIVLLGDLNANGDTKTANNKPIIQSIIAQPRTEASESVGTHYFFYNTTTYGAHSVIDYNYTNNTSNPDMKMPIAGADYTMLTDSYNNWAITPAYKINNDKSYAQFDYILLSRWPEGDDVYDTNTRMWCGHETNYSYITPVVGMSNGQRVISDHCAVVSKITVHNPRGYEVYDDTNVNFTIKTGTETKHDDSIIISATCNKNISNKFDINYDAIVGGSRISGTLPVKFTGTKYAIATTGSLANNESNVSSSISSKRSVITGLDFYNKPDKFLFGDYIANAKYRNDYYPTSVIYLSGINFNISSNNTSGNLFVKHDYKSYLNNTNFVTYYYNDLIEYDNNSIFIYDDTDLGSTWYYGDTKTIFKDGTQLIGRSNQYQYAESDINVLVLRIPCDFLLKDENPLSTLDNVQLSLANNPTINLIGNTGNNTQINYTGYEITKSNGYIRIFFYFESYPYTYITPHSSFSIIDPITVNIKVN